jgi:hypothetical protein
MDLAEFCGSHSGALFKTLSKLTLIRKSGYQSNIDKRFF